MANRQAKRKQQRACRTPNAVKALSYPGSIVLDFFAGSGTVGRVCIAEGRHCLLCDNDKATLDYFERHIEQMKSMGQNPKYKRVENLEEFFQA